MNEKLTETELDSRALEFLRESLTNATGVARWRQEKEQLPDGSIVEKSVPYDIRRDSLAHHVLEETDLATGTITTCVPGLTPREALYQFKEGVRLKAKLSALEELGEGTQGWNPVPEEDTYQWLIRVVMEYLRSDPDKVCMFDSIIKSPGDARVATLVPQPHIFQNQVYFSLFHKDVETTEIVESAISHANNAWFFYGVMSSLPAGSGLDPGGGEITSDVLEMLAQRAEKIIVSAYDGESYLIWRRLTT